jgi:hypothetical protein
METRKILVIVVLAFGLVLCWGKVSKAAAMGTAFTYQGRLIDANYAAEGVYDFNFGLYDSAGNGNQVGEDTNVPDVDVIQGYFTVVLDFNDANAFKGEARWLKIGVRPGDQNDPNEYTPLSPRQEITQTPYALYAKTAGSASGGGWVDDGAVVRLESSGDSVGIGTAGPGDKLDVTGHVNSSESYKLDGQTVVSNIGGDNIFVGKNAGASITTGNSNSAMGSQALYFNNTGSSNSAVGFQALWKNTIGGNNTAMGAGALQYNTGNSNTAMGRDALYANTTGTSNSAVGMQALMGNNIGGYNTAMGYGALRSNTTGRQITIIRQVRVIRLLATGQAWAHRSITKAEMSLSAIEQAITKQETINYI